jgi:hypothetical protein
MLNQLAICFTRHPRIPDEARGSVSRCFFASGDKLLIHDRHALTATQFGGGDYVRGSLPGTTQSAAIPGTQY